MTQKNQSTLHILITASVIVWYDGVLRLLLLLRVNVGHGDGVERPRHPEVLALFPLLVNDFRNSKHLKNRAYSANQNT